MKKVYGYGVVRNGEHLAGQLYKSRQEAEAVVEKFKADDKRNVEIGWLNQIGRYGIEEVKSPHW